MVTTVRIVDAPTKHVPRPKNSLTPSEKLEKLQSVMMLQQQQNNFAVVSDSSLDPETPTLNKTRPMSDSFKISKNERQRAKSIEARLGFCEFEDCTEYSQGMCKFQ